MMGDIARWDFVADLKESAIQASDRLLGTAGMELVRREVRLGGYKIDAIARCKQDNALVIVEFKSKRGKEALGQLLLYLEAVRRLVRNVHRPPVVRGLLVTTYLDENVLSVIRALKLDDLIQVKMVKGASLQSLELVDPDEVPESFRGDSAVRLDRQVNLEVLSNGEWSLPER